MLGLKIPVVVLTVGLQGSGKTRAAKELAYRMGLYHLELDLIRNRIWPDAPKEWSPYEGKGLEVQKEFERVLVDLVSSGRDVVVDRTNLTEEGRERILAHIGHLSRIMIWDLRDQSPEICAARDGRRPPETHVGRKVIFNTYARTIGKK